TRRQLSHWQQEKKRQRWIIGVGAFLVAATIIIVGAGWYVNQYRPLHQTVLEVNGKKYSMNYYVKAMEYYSQNYTGGSTLSFADNVAQLIVRYELAKEGAAKLGIAVNSDNVTEIMKQHQPPVDSRYRNLVSNEVLTRQLIDEHFDQEVPQSAVQRHIMAMLLESQQQAETARSRLETSDNFTAVATELSLEPISRFTGGDLGWLPMGVLPALLGNDTLENAAFQADVGSLSQPIYDEAAVKDVGYWLIKVLDRQMQPQEAMVQAILLGSEQEADQIRARLVAGEDIGDLAKQYSQLQSAQLSGADLGWITPDIATTAFADFAFDISFEPETLSEPIRDEQMSTKGGYWLTEVAETAADRPISAENRSVLKVQAFTNWVEEMEADPANQIKISLTDDDKTWAITRAFDYITGTVVRQ
ncbi:MAG: peptidylprolyl isomerase, partial [Chloroflexota bacterium]